METEHDRSEPSPPDRDEPDEARGALDEDNPPVPDDAGEKGAGTRTGAEAGLEHGSEPRGEDVRKHERP